MLNLEYMTQQKLEECIGKSIWIGKKLRDQNVFVFISAPQLTKYL